MKKYVKSDSEYSSTISGDELIDYLYEISDILMEAHDELLPISSRPNIPPYITEDLCYEAKELRNNIREYVDMCNNFISEIQ